MSFSRKVYLIAALFFAMTASAEVDVENEGSEIFTLSAYGRVRYSELGGALTVPDRSFSLESAGLTADFLIDDNLEGQLQLETLPDEFFIKDCYLEWSPSDIVSLQAGRFKKPFCLNSMLSTWSLQAIDHSITHRELSDLVYSGRDLGAEVQIEPGPEWLPTLSLGVFNGSLEGSNQDNELQYTGRMEFQTPVGLIIGGGISTLRFGREDLSSVDGYSVSARQIAFGADLQYGLDLSREFTCLVRGEFLRGDNWVLVDVIAGEEPPEFQTWWFTGGLTWSTRKPLLDAVSASVGMGSWEPDRSQGIREDEIMFTLEFHTGTPVGLQLAAVAHRPHNMVLEQKRTDYMIEMTFRI